MTPDSYTQFRPSISEIGTNGITLSVAETGSGSPILFLHGFPDHWGSWRRLMTHFSNSHHVIAPDLRGYGRSSRPRSLQSYRPKKLIGDVLALLENRNLEDVTLVGHDWGASLAFWTAMKDASRLKRLIILNGAHPYLLQDRIWDDPEQRRASQYMRFLTSDHASQRFNGRNASALAHEWLLPALNADKITQCEYEEYLALWSKDGAWAAMLNWYRAAPISVPDMSTPIPKSRWTEGLDYTIPCPVHVIWGDQDTVFSARLADDLRPHVSQLEVTHLANAGHVPHRDEPAACARIMRAAMFS